MRCSNHIRCPQDVQAQTQLLREQARRQQAEASAARHQMQLRLEGRHLAAMRASECCLRVATGLGLPLELIQLSQACVPSWWHLGPP